MMRRKGRRVMFSDQKSMNYFEEVRQLALEYDKTLDAFDRRFNGCVFVQHQDGTQIFYNSAFAVQYRGPDGKVDCVVVFTEHNGVQVFAKDDLNDFGQFEERTAVEYHSFGPEIREPIRRLADGLVTIGFETEESLEELIKVSGDEVEAILLETAYDALTSNVRKSARAIATGTGTGSVREHAQTLKKAGWLDENHKMADPVQQFLINRATLLGEL